MKMDFRYLATLAEIQEGVARRNFLEELANNDIERVFRETMNEDLFVIEDAAQIIENGVMVDQIEDPKGKKPIKKMPTTMGLIGNVGAIDKADFKKNPRNQLSQARMVDYLERKLHFHEKEKAKVDDRINEYRKIQERLESLPEQRKISTYTVNALQDDVTNFLEEFRPKEERISPLLEFYDSIYLSDQTLANILLDAQEFSKEHRGGRQAHLMTVGLFVYPPIPGEFNPFQESCKLKMMVWKTDRCMTEFVPDQRGWFLNLNKVTVTLEKGSLLELGDHNIHRAVLLHPGKSKNVTMLVHLKAKDEDAASCLQLYSSNEGETELNQIGEGQQGNFLMNFVDDVQQFKVNNARDMILVRFDVDSLMICKINKEQNPFENMCQLLMPAASEKKDNPEKEEIQSIEIVEYQFVERESWAQTDGKIEIIALTKDADLLRWTFTEEELRKGGSFQGTYLLRATGITYSLKYGKHPFTFSFSSCIKEKGGKYEVFDKVIIFSFDFPNDGYETQGSEKIDPDKLFKTTHLWGTFVLLEYFEVKTKFASEVDSKPMDDGEVKKEDFNPEDFKPKEVEGETILEPYVWHSLCVEKYGNKDCSYAVREFRQFDTPKYIHQGLVLRSERETKFLKRGAGSELITVMPKSDPKIDKEKLLDWMAGQGFKVVMTLPGFNCNISIHYDISDKFSEANEKTAKRSPQIEQTEAEVVPIDNREVLQLVSSKDVFHKDEVRCMISQPQSTNKIKILVI